jgi:hypothetical protein
MDLGILACLKAKQPWYFGGWTTSEIFLFGSFANLEEHMALQNTNRAQLAC